MVSPGLMTPSSLPLLSLILYEVASGLKSALWIFSGAVYSREPPPGILTLMGISISPSSAERGMAMVYLAVESLEAK